VKSSGCEGDTSLATYVCAVVSSVTGEYEAVAWLAKVMLLGIMMARVSVGSVRRGANLKLPL
jgi:hypothetical protein